MVIITIARKNELNNYLLNNNIDNFYSKDNIMENLRTNLKELTYAFIQLFYKTGKKYSCTQTKLGKLLSVLAFKYARERQILFNENIYKYSPNCGTLIKDLTFIPKDVYVRDFMEENLDKTESIDELLDNDVNIPETYNKCNTLSDELNKDIEHVFRMFGAYPASKLGELLNPIVDKIVDTGDDKIILEKIPDVKITDFKTEEVNEIVQFICK